MAKILQVCNSDFYLVKFLLPQIIALRAAGYEVDCVCEGADFPPEMAAGGMVIHQFESPRRLSLGGFWDAIRKMRRIIRAGRYDCVISHNRGASIIGRVAAWLEHVPVKVYTAHGFYFHDDQGPLAHEATVWIEWLLGRVTDFTLSQSSEDVEFAVRRGIASRDRIEAVGNGIATTRFTPREPRLRLEEALRFRTDRFRICATGRLVRGKGFIDLLEAFAELRAEVKTAELVIIGGNIQQDIEPFEREFLARVAALGLEAEVVITGMTSRVEDYLGISDVFVLPSYREGMPRSLLEAMSMGLPAIATRIRGCREIIVDGQNGFLFAPKDFRRLRDLLAQLYHSPELRERVGKQARETAVGMYDESFYVNRQVSAINRLLGAKISL